MIETSGGNGKPSKSCTTNRTELGDYRLSAFGCFGNLSKRAAGFISGGDGDWYIILSNYLRLAFFIAASCSA